MIVITDTNRFESIVSELERTLPDIEDVFKYQDKNFKMIDGTDSWKGSTQMVISDKYLELKKNYEPINESLRNYIKYLKITVENYKKYEHMVDKSVNENDDNLNII